MTTPATTTATAIPPATLPPTRAGSRLRGLWESTGMLLVFLVLFAGVSLSVENFLSQANMIGLLLSVATVGIIACTMLFCLAAGDFDLSVGSVVAMAGVLAAVVMNHTGSVLLGVGAGVLAGGVVGFVNGFVIAQLGINALITTLATMQIVRGLAYIVSGGTSVGITEPSFYQLGISSWNLGISGWRGLPVPVWIMLACFVVFGVALNRTVFGRNSLAVGGNYEAARLAGIRVVRTKIVIFSLQGLVAAFAGVILAARFTSGQPSTADGLELEVISACVLGGVSLTGGLGTMTGVVIGVLIMGTVNNAMNLLNIDSFYQNVVSGTILLAAVLLDKLKQRLFA